MISIQDYSYHLPEEYIAQTPASPRDHAKLMIVNRSTGTITHDIFHNLPNYLTSNDVLVLNDSKVFPARFLGTKATGGRVEVLLLRPIGNDVWEAMSNGLKPSQIVQLGDESIVGEVIQKDETTGFVHIRLTPTTNTTSLADVLDRCGHTPIPPYIHSPLTETDLRREYQTVYADQKGSAAAPTAGLHFTNKLLETLEKQGVGIERVTLHVGPGTFARLTDEQLASKTLHHEWYSINEAVADRLNQAKRAGKRIIAVGTTSCRVLESATSHSTLHPSHACSTNLFISPPYQFKFVDAMITNFHLPESSLLMLIAAFTTTPNAPHSFTQFHSSTIGNAYQQAIANHYRFFSFGDAMFIN